MTSLDNTAERNAIVRALRLRQFVEWFWHAAEPAVPFQANWHIGAVCDFLEAWHRRDFQYGVISLPPGTGKPVHVDEQVETPTGPRRLGDISVGDWVQTHRGRARRVVAVHEQGVLPTLTLRTFGGRELRMAADHPVLTARGWIQAQHLLPNSDVLVTVADAEDREAAVSPDLARWCGYMVGDGSCKYRAVSFTNADADTLSDYTQLCQAMGFDVRVRPPTGHQKATSLHPTCQRRTPSPVLQLLDDMQLQGSDSYTKRIPPQIANGALWPLANFIGAYWSCDGELRRDKAKTGKRWGQVVCEATTVSIELARDVQRALLRLGIGSRIRKRVSNQKTAKQGDTYTAWRLTVYPEHYWLMTQLPGLCARKRVPLPANNLRTQHIADPLVSVEQTEPGACRCLTVDEDASFVVRGVAVHNSLLVDVMYQAWAWAKEPGRKFLCCSYDLDLCLRDATKIDAIMRSEAYRAAWPEAELTPVTAKSNLWTTLGGYRFSTTPDGKGGLGRHFHDVSINDPVKAKDATGAELGAQLERAHRWIDVTMPTRRADPKRFGAMITMQRLLEKDPAGVALDRGWEHLCLPMRYEPRAHWIRGERSAAADPRRTPGELLHPARWDDGSVRQLEASLGHHASAQLQQNPIPRSGGLIEEKHLAREWVELPTPGSREWRGRQGYWVQVWDFAAKGTEATHSAVHGALWCAVEVDVWRTLANSLDQRDRGEPPVRVLEKGASETRYLLVDEVWGIWDVPTSEREFERAQSRPHWNRAAQRIIEAKASGIGIIQRYERQFSGIVAFHEIDAECKALAQMDKLDRLRANLGEWHAGRVLLYPWRPSVPDRVDPSDGPGPDNFRREVLAFPRGARDDRVDTSSMALARLVQGTNQWQANVKALARQVQRPGW